MQENRVQAQPARPRLPLRPRAVAAQAWELLPRLRPVGRSEQGGVFHAGVDGIGIGQRWFEMPDSLELPGVRRAIVPLVSAGNAVVFELVADRLPCLSTVVGTLDLLSEPSGVLRRIEPIRIRGGPFVMDELPAHEVRLADVPSLALSVRRHDECTLACTNQ